MDTNIFIVLFCIVFIATAIMELLRNCIKVKKDLLKKAILTATGIIVAFILVTIAYFAFDSMRDHCNPLAIVIYSLVVYFVQKDLDLEIIKPVVKKIMEKKI